MILRQFQQNPLSILFALLLGFSHTLLANNLDTQRDIYIRADHALKKHDRTNFERLKSQIPHYPLYPYLVYEDIKQNIQNTKPNSVTLETLEAFEKETPDFPFHNTLRNLWLVEMAKSKNWNAFVKGYRKSKNDALECQYYFAKYQTTQDKKYLAKAKPLWLVGYSQDKACDPLFQAWKKTGGITVDLINQRIKLALDKKNFDFAKQLSKQLATKDRQWVEEWEKLIKNPTLLFNDNYIEKLPLGIKIKAEILTYTLKILARKDPEKTAQWWGAYQTDILLNTAQKNQVKREIAIALAQQKSQFAETWLMDLPKEACDNVVLEWRIRTALANKEWAKVITNIETLPANEQEDATWQYWLARAKEALNQKQSAHEIYQKLAQTRNYYGFLASSRLNQPLSMQNEPLAINPKRYSEIFAKPAIKRFEELHLVKKETIARIEWFRAIDKMTIDELATAAQIAQKLGLHDIAIITIAKTPFRNDIALRFPLAHEPEVINNANKHNLDPAWVFAIARQESAFFTDALSPAGARGLMQLLPSTAKMVANQHNLPYNSETQLHQASMNVQLGTAYLKNLKTKMHNNMVLATASYNAGPGRIPRWLYDDPMDTDIWVENIPYKETRDYVKNVMAFTSIYRQRLGFPTGFALMLKPIPAKKAT